MHSLPLLYIYVAKEKIFFSKVIEMIV